MNKASPNHRLRFTLLFLALVALAVGGSTLRQRTVGAQEPKLGSPGQFDNYKGENVNVNAAGGAGVATLTANGGSCLSITPGNQVDQWEVVEGGSYNLTITGVTECTGDTITVFVQGGSTGNFCFNATLTAPGSGTYVGTFTMPNPACLTYPISYKCGANQPCNNAGTVDAKGPSGAPKVHLRASTFSDGCASPVEDAICTSPTPSPTATPSPTPREVPQGCIISVPAGSDLGCNPVSIPVCDTSQVVKSHVVGEVQCQYQDDTPPSETLCEHSRKITYTATGEDGTTCEATQTFTWKEDSTAPELHALPAGGELGCNPVTLPSCDANVTATDGCGPNAPTVSCTTAGVTGPECARTQTFTYSAEDGCGNKVSKDVTYTWKADTTKPVLNVPADADVECNAVPPVGAATADDNCDGALTPHYAGETRTNGSCANNYTLTRTWTATDSCGNIESKAQVIRVADTTAPVIGNPGPDATIYCPNQPVFTPPTATDNCGSAQVVQSGDDVVTNFSCGTKTVKRSWYAVDACGLRSGTVSQTITVECNNCGGLTIGFWQNKNGQGIITGGAATAGVANSATWLRNFNPFKDLSATSTQAQVAAYVTNVIKAANASGAAMNSMLKAQMLATALDVYFSDPALGGNKINAPAPIGGDKIDLTYINKPIGSASYENTSAAFGGGGCQTVLALLTYASGQSDSGGVTWYGQIKATQELAKDTFDAINNNVAFSCP